MTHASMDAAAQKNAGIGPTLIRLSVGIEDLRDLLADLDAAFAAVAAAVQADGGAPAVDTGTEQKSAAVTPNSEQHFRLNPALAAFW